jgi:hypothetical protein
LLNGVSIGGELKTEHFDVDPKWDAYHNRPAVAGGKVVQQNFGYSKTNHAGKQAGEIGGRVQRSTLAAYYADAIATKTLNDKLTASGSFAVTDARDTNGSLMFGWFNSASPAGGRPVNSLGMDIGFARPGGHLHVRVRNSANQSCGEPITPWPKPKPRGEDAAVRFPLRKDGTHYNWIMQYDPEGAGGKGAVQFSIRSNRDVHDEFEKTTFTVELPPGFKEKGATFDRFGLCNLMKTGGAVSIYFDDVDYDGKAMDFSSDPGWIGTGNRGDFRESNSAGTQDFGFDPVSNNAGGNPGEIGGIFWRSNREGSYYADRVSSLTLHDKVEAHGKICMLVGAPDSGVMLGWFNSDDRKTSSVTEANFLGVNIGGPTRVGHYFAPTALSRKGTRTRLESGPVLVPGKRLDWSIAYRPDAAAGRGELSVNLGDTSATLQLKPQLKTEGADFNRFGLLTTGHGGQMVKMYIDDVEYSTGPKR